MKTLFKFAAVALLMGTATTLFAQEQEKEEEKPVYQITETVNVKHTPVDNQGSSGTCWCFAGIGPPLGKMRPLPATASQGKSPVPPCLLVVISLELLQQFGDPPGSVRIDLCVVLKDRDNLHNKYIAEDK